MGSHLRLPRRRSNSRDLLAAPENSNLIVDSDSLKVRARSRRDEPTWLAAMMRSAAQTGTGAFLITPPTRAPRPSRHDIFPHKNFPLPGLVGGWGVGGGGFCNIISISRLLDVVSSHPQGRSSSSIFS